MKFERYLKSRSCGAISLFLIALTYIVGCGNKENFTQQAATDFFTQGYNPPYLDILWMLDDRSPMSRIKDHLVSEASNFFSRLDGITSEYRMAFVSADMQYADGQLKPQGNPVVLTKNVGTDSERVQLFGNIISQIINLQTGYADEGFESVRVALTHYFQPRQKVPLVLVFISDSDDHSPNTDSNGSAVNYYYNSYLQLKGNDASLLRIYSVNYEPGQPTDQNRCATRYDADIDSPGFQNRYFLLAQKAGGSTADLCGSFSSQIDLSGLTLTTLPSTFPLSEPPQASSIQVTITQGSQSVSLPWTYDSSTNSIDFSSAPPEGTTIQVTYLPQ